MSDTRSYGRYVLGLYGAMLKDITLSYPRFHQEFSRDYNRLSSSLDSHGIAFFCDAMVQYGKHFDRCLADSRLTRSGISNMRSSWRGSPVPRLFRGLMLRVFQRDGTLLSDPDVRAIEFLRQLYNLAKSLNIPCPTQRTYESVSEFIKTDSEVRDPTLLWDSPDFRPCDAHHLEFRDVDVHDLPPGGSSEPTDGRSSSSVAADFDVVQRTADIISSTLGAFKPQDWKCRHGPGAVADLRGGVLNKYIFPSWSARLETVFPCSEFAFANELLWADTLNNEVPSSVPFLEDAECGSRLIAVPKTYRSPRLIAAEPVSGQWAQQCVRDFLMTRVRSTPVCHSIRFSDQGHNGRMALEASRNGDYATIDLSSASDRISCFVIERLFRRNPTLLHALWATRSLWMTQDLDKKSPRNIKLRKFSTMGSAVTFPIQTILFTVIAVSAVLITENRKANIKQIRSVSRRVRVFGDDIIVPTHAWTKTMELLSLSGLKVNTSKTFGVGYFRESCGVDAYRGALVPKININSVPSRTKPETVLSAIDCHNNLFSRGLWNTASYVRRAVEKLGRYAIPSIGLDSGLIGWFTFDTPQNSHLKDRWNSDLCRREYLVSQPSAESERIQPYGNHNLLQYFTECPQRFSFLRKGERLGVQTMGRSLKLRRTWAPLW